MPGCPRVERTVCCEEHTHPVSVPILPPRESQALWSQNHDTEIPRCDAVSRVDSTGEVHTTREKRVVSRRSAGDGKLLHIARVIRGSSCTFFRPKDGKEDLGPHAYTTRNSSNSFHARVHGDLSVSIRLALPYECGAA